MTKTFKRVAVALLIIQAFAGSYGWGRFISEKAINDQLRSTLEDVQSTCTEYENEISELYKQLRR